MKFNRNTISLILLCLVSLSFASKIRLSTNFARTCLKSGLSTSPPAECRWVNIVGPGGLCVSAKSTNSNVLQAACSSDQDVLWNVVPKGSGFLIQNFSGQVLNNSANKSDNGNKITGYGLNNQVQQIWKIVKSGSGNSVWIKQSGNSKCFDNTGTIAAGRYYHLWDCSSTNVNQRFEFRFPTPIATAKNKLKGYFNIKGNSGMCLADQGALKFQKCTTANEQLWRVLPFGGGYIMFSKIGNVFDNANYGSANKNPVGCMPRANNDAQIWMISSVNSGNKIAIKNIQRSKCIDDTGAAVVGTQAYIYDCGITNKNQWFEFVTVSKNVDNVKN